MYLVRFYPVLGMFFYGNLLKDLSEFAIIGLNQIWNSAKMEWGKFRKEKSGVWLYIQNQGDRILAVKKVKTTKLDIIKCASKFLFEEGYTHTSPRMICDALNIYTGNLTYYFPTKEHLLAEFVDMLCDFQWKMMEEEAQEGISSVMAICLELTAMVVMCEESPVAKDFYLASYVSPMCLEIIRKNDTKRAKQVFLEYCKDWTNEQFAEAEILVSGIEYATLMTTGEEVSLEMRISGALNQILIIYGVPEEIRNTKIQKVFAMDYRNIGRKVLKEFRKYVEETNEQAMQALLKRE